MEQTKLLLKKEKSKFTEIDERIQKEQGLLNKAREDKQAAEYNVDMLSVEDANKRINAHSKALEILREKRTKLMSDNSVVREIELVVSDDLVENDEIRYKKRKAIVEKLKASRDELKEMWQEQLRDVQEAERMVTEYAPYLGTKRQHEISRRISNHNNTHFHYLTKEFRHLDALIKTLDVQTMFTSIREKEEAQRKIANEIQELERKYYADTPLDTIERSKTWNKIMELRRKLHT